MSAIRYAGLFLAVLMVLAIGADEPSRQPVAGPQESSALKQDSHATDQIQKALQGKSVETGDGILDDMLDVLQERGSILDGSSLDEGLDRLSPASGVSLSPDSNHAHAAESLLKSARLLEKLGKLGSKQQALVVQMRRVAVDLLTSDASSALR